MNDKLLKVGQALCDYLNDDERLKDMKNGEMFTFSIPVFRTGEDEMTFGRPCIEVTKYID